MFFDATSSAGVALEILERDFADNRQDCYRFVLAKYRGKLRVYKAVCNDFPAVPGGDTIAAEIARRPRATFVQICTPADPYRFDLYDARRIIYDSAVDAGLMAADDDAGHQLIMDMLLCAADHHGASVVQQVSHRPRGSA